MNSDNSVIFIFLKILFPISLVVSITFLSWHFNDYNLMWWFLISLLAYMSV